MYHRIGGFLEDTLESAKIVTTYGSVTELKAWVLVFEAVLSAPRVFVREIAPYMLSRWKVRYIVNPVLSTLSRRSLYQFPPGCMLHHFIISLFLARITRFPVSFAPTAILFLLFPLPTFVSTALSLFLTHVSFFSIVCSSCLYRDTIPVHLPTTALFPFRIHITL